MASEVVWGHLRPFCQKLLFDIFKRSRLHFDWFYGHWLLNGLRGWVWTRRKSAPWVSLWDFFGWHNWIIYHRENLFQRDFPCDHCQPLSRVWGHYWHSLCTFIMHIQYAYSLWPASEVIVVNAHISRNPWLSSMLIINKQLNLYCTICVLENHNNQMTFVMNYLRCWLSSMLIIN